MDWGLGGFCEVSAEGFAHEFGAVGVLALHGPVEGCDGFIRDPRGDESDSVFRGGFTSLAFG